MSSFDIPRSADDMFQPYNMSGTDLGFNSTADKYTGLANLSFGNGFGSTQDMTGMDFVGRARNDMVPTVDTGIGSIRPPTGKLPLGPEKAAGGLTMPGWQKFGYIMDGIGSLGQVYAAIQANKLGKQSLAFQKEAFNENMKNTKSSFNMALEDKISSRQAMNGLSDQAVSDYLKKYTLT